MLLLHLKCFRIRERHGKVDKEGTLWKRDSQEGCWLLLEQGEHFQAHGIDTPIARGSMLLRQYQCISKPPNLSGLGQPSLTLLSVLSSALGGAQQEQLPPGSGHDPRGQVKERQCFWLPGLRTGPGPWPHGGEPPLTPGPGDGDRSAAWVSIILPTQESSWGRLRLNKGPCAHPASLPRWDWVCLLPSLVSSRLQRPWEPPFHQRW